jgi:hypothetical protein
MIFIVSSGSASDTSILVRVLLEATVATDTDDELTSLNPDSQLPLQVNTGEHRRFEASEVLSLVMNVG